MNRLLIFILALLFLSGCNFLEIDKCLDGGGKWNYEDNKCEFNESNQFNK